MAKLLSDIKREEIMKQWGYWRNQIADGFIGSYPRDWFESVLDYMEEEYQNRTITIRTKEIAE